MKRFLILIYPSIWRVGYVAMTVALLSAGCNFKSKSKLNILDQRPAQTLSAPQNNAPSREILATADTRLRMISRYEVHSILVDIFGETARDSSSRLVLSRFEFGGPCSLYNSANFCNYIGDSQTPIIPSALTASMGLLTRACDKIVSNDVAIAFAVSQTGGSTLAQPTNEEIEGLFDLFYPGKEPSPQVTSALRAVATQAQAFGDAPIESWRAILSVLCRSGEWQSP